MSRVAFCQPSQGLPELADGEFLQALTWEAGAPKTLTAAAADGDVERFYRKLQKRDFANATGGAGSLRSTWSLGSDGGSDRAVGLIKILDGLTSGGKTRRSERKLASCLDDIAPAEPFSALELQLLLELLRQTGGNLPVDLFAALWRLTLTAAVELSAELDESRGSQAADHERLMAQGELPWEAGLLFSDVGGAEVLREFGRQHLAEQLEDKTDTDGTPHGDILDEIGRWIAPLVRSIQWGTDFGCDLWDEEGGDRFQQLIASVVPLCRADGRLPFQNGRKGSEAALLESAARSAGLAKGSVARRYLKAVAGRGKHSGSPVGRGKSPRPVLQSDWARVASLRSSWEPGADLLVVAHHRPQPQLELSAAGKLLLSGAWDIELSVDGESLEFADQWTCTCWHSDHDGDYLEIQFSFEEGIQVERQILLSRTDHFAILADAVSAPGERRIEYSSTLPVVDGLKIESDVPTRECRLRRKGLLARAFPLALPDDRIQSTPGGLAPAEGGLELRQIADGGLYAPLVLDWHKDRRRREADWRTVTVSEAGQVQKSAAASGHRLRIGNHQLLVYRSLRHSQIPRAVLGQHMANETLIGRFHNSGDVTPLLVVE